tara:strand:- start:2006 stop:2506 length:501 start_codon:yes stop_codon:yes gene_type:complete
MAQRTREERLLEQILNKTTKVDLNTDGLELSVGGKYDTGSRSLSNGDIVPVSINSDGETIVALSATDNAVLDNIKLDTESIETSNKLALGDNGCVMINGNAAQSESAGTYFAVQFLKACTPTTLTIGSSTTVTGQEIPAGTIIYGDITAITGDSGALYVLYKGNPA